MSMTTTTTAPNATESWYTKLFPFLNSTPKTCETEKKKLKDKYDADLKAIESSAICKEVAVAQVQQPMSQMGGKKSKKSRRNKKKKTKRMR
jgi:hypothetical protein